MTNRTVRIGGASGSLRDSALAVPQLLRSGPIDYLVFDFLAEGSMGLLALFKQADPNGGFAPDFIPVHMQPHLREILDKGVKIVANAGGVNPHGCAAALQRVADELGLKPRIAVIAGDDLRDQVESFRAGDVCDMYSGAPFPDQIDSINAYLGGFPIAAALAQGADIVITGRVVDSALTLGPLIHEFGWKPEDYDLLAAGTLAGHLLECGAQVTGGTFTDWRAVPDWTDIGYPIAECRADGYFVVTKPENSGGLVSRGTVAEQMIYEISDPQCYFVPDVSCDFSTVTLEELGPNRVGVSNVRGLPPTSTYKVCTIHRRGWRGFALQPILGFDAAAKAERQSAALIERTRRMLQAEGLGDWTRTHVDLLGTEACFGEHGRYRDAREVLCRIIVEHGDKRAAEIFAREQIMAIMAMSVGTTIGIGTAVTPVQELFSFLLDKKATSATLTIDGVGQTIPVETSGGFAPELIARPPLPAQPDLSGTLESVPLIGLAWARSGDKGDLFNVGVIARDAEYLPYIAAALTPAAVARWYAHVFEKGGTPRVERFDLPGTHAINFVLHNALAGGITSSPRLDSVAKGMAQQLLGFPVPVPAAIAAKIDRSLLDFDAKPFSGAI
jgi:hypothetical protein